MAKLICILLLAEMAQNTKIKKRVREKKEKRGIASKAMTMILFKNRKQLIKLIRSNNIHDRFYGVFHYWILSRCKCNRALRHPHTD